jgi:hypothetical protein
MIDPPIHGTPSSVRPSHRHLSLLAALLAPGCVADPDTTPDYTWEVSTQGAAFAVATTADGDIVVAGTRAGDVWLASFDAETGDELWSTTRDWMGGPDEGVSLAVSGDAIYVVGTAWTGGNADPTNCEDPEVCPQYYGIWFAEFAGDGTLLWDEVYAPEPNSENEGTGVAIASDGYPVVVGQLDPSADGGAWIRRYGPNATVVWETIIPAYASATDVVVTAQDVIYVADGGQRRLHRLDADGTLSWSVDTDDGLKRIALTPQGDLVGISTLGEAYGFEADGTNTWTFLPSRIQVWAEGVAVDSNGHIAVVGSAYEGEASQRQIWAQGIDPDGAPSWTFQHWYGAAPTGMDFNVDTAMAATYLAGGDLILVGSVDDSNSTTSAWLARWSP